MIGFAVIDNADPTEVAVWLVSRTGAEEVKNTNAVVVDPRQPDSAATIAALIADRVVLLTAGSTPIGLPLKAESITTDDLTALIKETDAQYERVLAAVNTYAMQPDPKTGKSPTKPRPLVPPSPPAHPREGAFQAKDDSAPARALNTANYLRSVWTAWLDIESERKRRARTKTGELWMMPEEFADPDIAEFPESFITGVEVQPC